MACQTSLHSRSKVNIISKSKSNNSIIINGSNGAISSSLSAGGSSIPKSIHATHNSRNNGNSFCTFATLTHLQTTAAHSDSQCANSLEEVDKEARNIISNSNDPTMAGDLRILEGKRQRRHWTLRDRSAMSVHFLKANLAQDGCEEAQLDVAKRLLQDSKDSDLLENSQKENARLAVYWLVKSSEQGNEEATKLLDQCLKEGHGINPQNLADVKVCVNTPGNDKLTFKAARMLFMKLNNGEKFITTTQLLARIKNVENKAVRFDDEEEFDESNQSSLNSTSTQEDEEEATTPRPNVSLNETFTFKRPRRRPNDDIDDPKMDKRPMNPNHESPEGERLTLDGLLKCAAAFNAGTSPRPAIDSSHNQLGQYTWTFGSQINAFLLLLLCSVTGSFTSFQCVMYGATLLSIWASFNILGWSNKYHNFKDWSKAFGSIKHDNHVWTDLEAEERLMWKSLLPYLLTILVSFGVVYVTPGHNSVKLVTGTIVITALLMQTMFPTPRTLIIIMILVLPKVVHATPDYLDLLIKHEDLQAYLKFALDLFDLKLDAIAVQMYLIPIVQSLAIMSLILGSRKTFVLRILPELIASLWITRLGGILLEAQDDIVVSCVGVMIGATLVALMILLHSSQLNFYRRALYLVFLLGVSAACMTWFNADPLRAIASSFSSSKNMILNIDSFPVLDWKTYDKECHRTAWKTRSPAATQLFCFDKYGKTPMAVRWSARVSVVKVKEIQSSIIPSLNEFKFEIMLNLLGTNIKDHQGPSWQNFLPGSDSKGHPAPAIIIIPTSHITEDSHRQKIIDFVISLHTGDVIEFHGILSPVTVGSLRPEIEHLQSIKCIQCPAREEHKEYFILSQSQRRSDDGTDARDSHQEHKNSNNGPSFLFMLGKRLEQLLEQIKALLDSAVSSLN